MCLISVNGERRPSFCCLVRWLPIVIILALLVWSYYVFVYQICISKVSSIISMCLMLLGYHLLLFMFLWTWWRCICCPPVRIPDQWRLSAEDVDKLKRSDLGAEAEGRILANAARNLPITMSTPQGTVRYCRTCWIIKPDRAHHCKTCRRCIRRMDHHCPWVANCVHFHNYKYFILFVFYAEVYMLYLLSAMTYDFYLICQFVLSNLRQEQIVNLFQHVVCFIFNVFTLVMVVASMAYVAQNRTTMEASYPPYFFICGQNKNGFNLGCCANIREILGDKWYLWPFPIQTARGDGLTYPLATERLNAARVQGRRIDDAPGRMQVFKGNMALLLGVPVVSDVEYATD